LLQAAQHGAEQRAGFDLGSAVGGGQERIGVLRGGAGEALGAFVEERGARGGGADVDGEDEGAQGG
jgi:hypothetical protein